MLESQRLQVQRADERIDRAHRIVLGHIASRHGGSSITWLRECTSW